MGNRYFVTDVQLGIMIAYLDTEVAKKSIVKVRNILDEILTNQYLCEAEEFNKMLKSEVKK